MAQVLVRPSRHEFDFIEIGGGRRQAGLETVPTKDFLQGLTHPTDEIIGLDIGDTPVPTGSVALFVLLDQLLFKRDKKHDTDLAVGRRSLGCQCSSKATLGRSSNLSSAGAVTSNGVRHHPSIPNLTGSSATHLQPPFSVLRHGWLSS